MALFAEKKVTLIISFKGEPRVVLELTKKGFKQGSEFKDKLISGLVKAVSSLGAEIGSQRREVVTLDFQDVMLAGAVGGSLVICFVSRDVDKDDLKKALKEIIDKELINSLIESFGDEGFKTYLETTWYSQVREILKNKNVL
ncbi:hypothetical protein GF352_04460 [archaeon]|nr:hypothetical protein [archaeon]